MSREYSSFRTDRRFLASPPAASYRQPCRIRCVCEYRRRAFFGQFERQIWRPNVLDLSLVSVPMAPRMNEDQIPLVESPQRPIAHGVLVIKADGCGSFTLLLVSHCISCSEILRVDVYACAYIIFSPGQCVFYA